MASPDTEIEERSKALGYNFMPWKMPHKKGFILFRHMLTNPNFEWKIDKVTPINESMTNFVETESQLFMGVYAPIGVRMSRAEFLREYSEYGNF